MAKQGVLIFNMPERCVECPVHSPSGNFNNVHCTYKDKTIDKLSKKRPDWCPLIEVSKADITRARMHLERLQNEKENRL